MFGWLRSVWDFFFGLSSDAWGAMAAWAGILVGIATVITAGVYVKRQIDAARALQNEQAQPNVVALMEEDPAHWTFIDFVIKNFGQTPAYDIRIGFEPELAIAPVQDLIDQRLVTHLAYPKTIPFLAPGQEWRTAWDSGIARANWRKRNPDVHLETAFSGKVTCKDSSGNTHTTTVELDWSVYEKSLKVDTKTVHDIAKILEKHSDRVKRLNDTLATIEGTLSGYANEHGGVWVYPSSAAEQQAYLEQQRAEAAERDAQRRARLDSLRGSPPEGENTPTSTDGSATEEVDDADDDESSSRAS